MNAAGEPLLSIRDLSIEFGRGAATRRAVERVSLELARGEILGLVGESGSGKTLTARSMLGLWPPGARVLGGSIRLEEEELVGASPARWRALRGVTAGMVFQEPMTSLNPALKVGVQLQEGLRAHTRLAPAEIRTRVLDMLAQLGMPDPEACLERYPHEFSGGMRQRVMLASVLSLRPRLLVADEPTTALDAVIATQVLQTMVEAARGLGTAVLLVSHDLSAVARFAERVVVMRAGRVVETGATASVLLGPRDPYTKALLESLPRRKPTTWSGDGEVVAAARSLTVSYPGRGGWLRRQRVKPVLRNVDIDLREGETLAVVGESGSGKTTLGRALLGLLPAVSGGISLLGAPVAPRGTVPAASRRRAQLVFQDPFAALDPRMRVSALVGEGLRDLDRRERARRVEAMLAQVGLAGLEDRYSHELSGGQRQRVVIARALVTDPRLVVADEPVSALDITVQAQVLSLLEDLQRRFGFGMLFVSHDLAVVAQVADRIAIMQSGRVVEYGSAAAILDRPAHPYTRRLWSAAPRLRPVDGGFQLVDDRPPESVAPAGMRFAATEDRDEQVARVGIAPDHEVLCAPASL